MTRVISGRWGGRQIKTPAGQGTRPTSDRVREALFSSLEAWFGGLEGLRVLDLYAGSGALGLEALSRGAESVDLVEKDPKAAAVVTANVKSLGAGSVARVHRGSALGFLEGKVGDGPLWDLALLDPPYTLDADSVREVLAVLEPLVDPDGLVVLERPKREEFVWPEPFAALRDRRYGEARIWYGR